MSKSILVIDTPENCCGCDLEYGHYCGKEKRYIDEEEFETIPDWCPLRYLPEKKPKVKYQGNGCFGINEAMKNSFNMGFNSCIDEILKGANGIEQRTSL